MSIFGEAEAVHAPLVVIEGRDGPVASTGGFERVQVRQRCQHRDVEAVYAAHEYVGRI